MSLSDINFCFFFRHSLSSSYFSLQARFKLLESFNSSRFLLFSTSKAYLSASFLYFSIAISSRLFWAFKAAISFSILIAPTLFLFFCFCFSSNAFLYLKWACLAFCSNALTLAYYQVENYFFSRSHSPFSEQ